jgi:hypothetical protein
MKDRAKLADKDDETRSNIRVNKKRALISQSPLGVCLLFLVEADRQHLLRVVRCLPLITALPGGY